MNIIQSNLDFNGLSYGNNPNKIILHHAEASSCTVETIHDWHKNGNGWAGIGYHYFVAKTGQVYTGRPVNAVGAHCPGQNAQSIGICAEGSYMSEPMPAAQKNAIIELCIYLKDKYGISEVGGHRDYYSTDCPGTNYPLNEIRNAILSGSYSGSVSTSSSTTSRNYMRVGDRGDNVIKLQNNLISLGYSVGTYEADGIYGEATKEAVVKFQLDQGIGSDGLAGPKTLEAIDETLKIKKTEAHKPYIVCYNNEIDKRAALYLSEFLSCECIDNSIVKMNYESYYPVCVGGGEFTSYCKLLIKGADRFKTMLEVAKYIEERR